MFLYQEKKRLFSCFLSAYMHALLHKAVRFCMNIRIVEARRAK